MLPWLIPSNFAAAQQLFLQRALNPMMNVPLPTGPPRPAPMLVPPGMAAEDSNANNSPQLQPPLQSTASGSDWTEHKHTDGRVYYHHRVTKESSWVKPDELKTPQEKSQPSTTPTSVWREYRAESGKSYYYNTATKETTWVKPEDLVAGADAKAPIPMTEAPPLIVDQKPSTLTVDESEMDKAMKATLASMTLPPAEDKKLTPTEPTNDEQDLKKRQAERFRELLRDKYNDGKITSNCSWDHACKFIQSDPRFRILNKVSEKKQLFNAWKVQRQKEERDEKRLAIKKAKENLEKWLQDHSKMKENLRFNKACEIFAKEPMWNAVHQDERYDIFNDVLLFVTRRDKDKKKEIRNRNITALSNILQTMDQITYKTTWAQAQRLLIENPDFANDKTLQSMDKEDALIVFEDHIKTAEKEHDVEKELEDKRMKRQERKVREAFQQLLQEMHKRGELTSMSLWTANYPILSTDPRFDAMLSQSGSTPLDLFKFYVEELKEQYVEDRRRIKDILTASGKVVKVDTPYEEFAGWITSHQEKGSLVDHGNMKLCYNSLVEKAEAKEKETEREEVRKKKRVESEFRSLLRAQGVELQTEWAAIKGKIEKEKAFLALETDDAREKCFDEYKVFLAEACNHHHSSTSKKKKKDKKRKGRKSDKDSESEGEIKEKKKKKKHSKEERSDEDGGKKKKSRKRSHSSSSNRSGDEKRRRHDSNSN